MPSQPSETIEYCTQKTIGGYSLYKATDEYRTSIALILNGEGQQHAEIGFHSCTLESGDHVHSFSSVGSVRKKNQDRLLISPDHAFIFLADGYGEFGDLIADSIALYCLENPNQSLRNIAVESQRRLNDVAENLSVKPDAQGKVKQKGGIACGFTRILKDEQSNKKNLNYLRIGDVNIAILRQGEVVLRTTDETLEQQMLARGIPPNEARKKSNVIRNAISADDNNLECDPPKDFELMKGDIILIGCDGVMKDRTNIELEETIKSKNPKEMAQWLAQKGYEGYDNITAAVIEIT